MVVNQENLTVLRVILRTVRDNHNLSQSDKAFIDYVLYENDPEPKSKIDAPDLDEASRRMRDSINHIVADAPMGVRSEATATQVGGEHYRHMAIQPAVFCEKNNLSHLESSVVKRMCRWNTKGNPLEDLLKAKHEIDLMIEIHEVK